jgi:PAS domain S-box-containing protein
MPEIWENSIYMSDLLFLISPERKILTINETVSQTLGYNPQELIGKSMESVVFETQNQKAENVGINTIKMLMWGDTKDIEISLKTKTGNIVQASIAISAVRDSHGKVTGFACIARDITAQKRAQQHLQNLYEREKSLRQDIEKEMNKRVAFTRMLVHELKTPLAAIMSASELMDSEENGSLPTKLTKIIRRSASHLDTRIDELFDLAQGEVGLLQIKWVMVDPLVILHQVNDSMFPLVSSQRQSLLLDLPASLPQIKADKDRLHQILFNLIDNALKYNADGGKITLRAQVKDGHLVISVQDTGRGISKEDQSNIFDPYVRLETGKKTAEGLGLGLAICKMLITLHRGQIWIESEPGKGSTFTFTLPLTSEEETISSHKP